MMPRATAISHHRHHFRHHDCVSLAVQVQRAFLFLMDASETAKRDGGALGDRLRGCEVALEEARGRGLMLEEAISRQVRGQSVAVVTVVVILVT